MTYLLNGEITPETVEEMAEALRTPGALTLEINSPGGDVMAGMSVHSVLAARREDVTVEVIGLAGSIASVIALAGRELVMHAGTYLMLHKPWSFTVGDAEELRKTGEILDKIEGQLIEIYASASGQDPEVIRSLISKETWLSADEAVQLGFADRVLDTGRKVAMLDLSRFENVPLALKNSLSQGDDMDETTKVQDAPTKDEIMAMVTEAVKAATDKPTGRKVEPTTAKAAPAILARGMKRDGDPLNIGGYFRGVFSGNWKGADREREIHNAMTSTGDGSGIIPDRIASEIWLQLLEVSALNAAGAPVIQLPAAGVSVPFEGTAPSAAWYNEGEEIVDSGGAIDNAALTAYKIGFLREVSNELLQDAPAAADSYIRSMLLNALSRGLSDGFLNGSTAKEPTGLLTGTPGYEDTTGGALSHDAIMAAAYRVIGAGGNPANVRAIMAPAAATFLDQIRENDGQTSEGGYLAGSVPVQVQRVLSDAVAVTAGTPDTSQVLVGDFSQAVRVYSFGGMKLAVDPSAAFGRDSVTFRLTQRVDLQVAYPSLLVRLDDVEL
jgi:HK97 family phage major capsid protein/ATP-dependent Clp endopeptidase proteolytic subunit ClpP